MSLRVGMAGSVPFELILAHTHMHTQRQTHTCTPWGATSADVSTVQARHSAPSAGFRQLCTVLSLPLSAHTHRFRQLCTVLSLPPGTQ